VNTETLQVVYVSQLAPGQHCTVFSTICRGARARNLELGISGVLLFDGERFLHWLHGPPDGVSQLMEAIVADPRHTAVRVLLHTPLPVAEATPHWRAGFVDAEALDSFIALEAADRDAVLDGLARLVAQADLDPVLLAPDSSTIDAGPGRGLRD
jgi:hypothetical protein